jgi:hypothetical protein
LPLLDPGAAPAGLSAVYGAINGLITSGAASIGGIPASGNPSGALSGLTGAL